MRTRVAYPIEIKEKAIQFSKVNFFYTNRYLIW
ncbi:hypothetical protein A5875_000166 [Enterococcus sp. 3H8_DIV0648]|nr:hypothetical protein A5875_000166 [Enterococcus sp. 3H8_DIV0648]